MSCKIPYIEQQFRDVNPSLADTLNTKYSQIWDSVIESELFKKEDDTGKYLMATTNISRLQEQQDFIDKINQDNSVPEGASVIENLNGYVNVNVLNLPEVTGVSTSTIKEGVEELFNENPELSSIGTPQQYSAYLDNIFPDSKVKDIVYHGSQQKISEFEVRKEPLIHFGSKNAALQRGNILNQVIVNITDLQSIKDGMWFLGTDEGGLLKELLDRNILTLEQVISINEAKNKAIQQSPYFNENYRMALPEGEKSGNKKLQEILANQNIGFEYINLSEDKGSISYAVPSQKQIHILGNKQDIEGFKEFVSKQPKPTIDYTSLDVTASLDAETKAKIDYLRNNDDLTVQC